MPTQLRKQPDGGLFDQLIFGVGVVCHFSTYRPFFGVPTRLISPALINGFKTSISWLGVTRRSSMGQVVGQVIFLSGPVRPLTREQVDRENKNQSKARILPIWEQVREAFLGWDGAGDGIALLPLDKSKANVSHLIKVAGRGTKSAANSQEHPRGAEFPIVPFSPLVFPDEGLLTPKGKRCRARGGYSCGQRFLHFVQVNVPTPKHLCR